MNEEQSEAKSQTLDPEAWVDQYGDYLYRYAISRIHEPAVAEDLVQETLLAALQGKEGFKGRSSEKTWLTGILKYKIIDHIRKKSREQPTDTIELVADTVHEHFDDKGKWKVGPAKWTVNPTELLKQKQFWKVFYSCLSKLSERLAKAFVLRELDGLSSQEIREILNISATNSYVMLYRARMRMRDCLEVNWLGHGKVRKENVVL
jgi:RNA polymerase sigma-70 factor (ECF subfamily)